MHHWSATHLATRASSTARTGPTPSSPRPNATIARIRGTFLALTVDLDALTSPWRYDDPGKPYPHIYGPIDRAAIVGVTPVSRAADGRFLGLADP